MTSQFFQSFLPLSLGIHEFSNYCKFCHSPSFLEHFELDVLHTRILARELLHEHLQGNSLIQLLDKTDLSHVVVHLVKTSVYL